MKLKNDLILRVARRENTERIPVWLMRQAGRILPEYRKIRESISGFKELVKNPELAAEVSLQPVDILGVDAAIIFSDILVIPEAMGLPYEMEEKKGPYFPKTVNSAKDLDQLRVASGDELSYVYEALTHTRQQLDGRVPLIGFCGAPWTILAYMIEGSGSKTFSRARGFLYRYPELAHRLLSMITESSIHYLKKQVTAGADLLQIFDSWAGILPPDQYRSFSMNYIKQIANAVESVPVTVFAKGAWFALEEMNSLPCEVIGLDWNISPEKATKYLPGKALQGNLDPCVLYASPEEIRTRTRDMLARFNGHPLIANLGHGVYPNTDPDRVKIFIETVKEFRHTSIPVNDVSRE